MNKFRVGSFFSFAKYRNTILLTMQDYFFYKVHQFLNDKAKNSDPLFCLMFSFVSEIKMRLVYCHKVLSRLFQSFYCQKMYVLVKGYTVYIKSGIVLFSSTGICNKTRVYVLYTKKLRIKAKLS